MVPPSAGRHRDARVAPARRVPHVVVSGNIASGKTTLTQYLASTLELTPYFERPESNPFLERFYDEPQRYALPSQLWFTSDSVAQHVAIQERGGGVQDHSAWENVFVFGAVQRQAGVLEADEHELLEIVGRRLLDNVAPPAVVVLLEASADALLERVRRRGRPYEQSIDSGYLATLQRQRQAFFDAWDLCPVVPFNTEEHDINDAPTVPSLAARVNELLATTTSS